MSESFSKLQQRESQSLCRTYGRYPLAVARARGSRLYDFDGRAYVDLMAGIAVANLGHCRPELAEIMAKQAEKLVHVSNLFYQEEQVLFAEKLLGTCHADKVFFCNSGAEANEASIKLARRYMQKVRGRNAYEIITLDHSFHGRTLATIAATGQDKVKEGFAPIPEGFTTVPWDDLEALEKAIGPKTAGVLVEIVQGEGGVRPMSETYAKEIAALCKRKDILFMVDEIQTGLCRTGYFWAFQRFGLKPDVFSSAKGLANGLPLGAMLATEEVAKGFEPGAHATTFGGNPVLCAVATKVVELLQTEKLAQRALDSGAYVTDLLVALQQKHTDKITEIRSSGLMVGVEFATPCADIWNALLQKGFICNCTQGNVLRILPPLNTERDDLRDFVAALGDILDGK